MACCAFALFVIGQIGALLVAIGRALGLSVEDGPPPVNPATAWQLHAAPATAVGAPAFAVGAPANGRRRLAPALGLIVVLEIGLVATGAAWVHRAGPVPDGTSLVSLGAWCGRPPPVRSASLRD
jgi:hypothetical protein